MRKAKFKKSLIVLLGVVFLQPRVWAEEETSIFPSTPAKQSDDSSGWYWNKSQEIASQLADSARESFLYYWPNVITSAAGAAAAGTVGWRAVVPTAKPTAALGAAIVGGTAGSYVPYLTPEFVKKGLGKAMTGTWQGLTQAKDITFDYLSSLTGSDNPGKSPQQILVTDPVLSEKMQKQEVDIEELKRQIQLNADSHKKAIDELQQQLKAKSGSTLNVGEGSGGSGEPPHLWAVSLAEQVEQNKAAIGDLQHQIYHNDKKAIRGIAAMAALANVASPSAPGKTIVGAGIGSYHGTQAVAVNISHRPKSFSNTTFQAGIGTSTGGKPVIRAGVSYEF